MVKINSLDIEDDLEWGVQFGTPAYDEPSALVVFGSRVYVVGTVSDDSNVLSESMYAFWRGGGRDFRCPC